MELTHGFGNAGAFSYRPRSTCSPCRSSHNDGASVLLKLGTQPSQSQVRKVLLPAIQNSREKLQPILKHFASEAAAMTIFKSLEVLQEDGQFALDARDYTIGISSCARSKIWQNACWLFAAMPSAAVQRNVFTYSAA